ncbi:MAG: serpin family protein [Clostridia bacterium]|nr:serpin family protein [Clostridia bacterium]
MKKIISVLLCITLIALSFSACGGNPLQKPSKVKSTNLMNDITPKIVHKSNNLSDGNSAYNDFAVALFKENQVNGDNVLISPLSVLCALSMTANGANNDTLKEMEKVFGLSTSDMNKYLYSYINGLEQGEKFSLKLANSLWIKNDNNFTVNRDFLQTNANYHDAEIYSVPFDNDTLKDVNTWVKENTDGMIPNIIDKFDDEIIMCLINALAFEAEWAEIYREDQVNKSYFYASNGKTQNVDFMFNEEYMYLSDKDATGFMKYYADEKYAFVAVLPNENIKLEDYISNLTGEKITRFIDSAENTTVWTRMPKFQYEYSADISDILMNMGMPSAFDVDNADFTKMGTYTNKNIYINKVIHKTYISVAEKGTKAGAATAVMMASGSAMFEVKKVYLDKPFMYMIIDCENNVPFFIGTVTDLEG